MLEIRKLCGEKLLELGVDSFWYWNVGAFVFAGDETTVSVSGKQCVTSDRVIGNNDIITIDLSPERLGIISSKEAGHGNVQELVSKRWQEILKGTELVPIDVHTPMWLWSRDKFSVEI